MVVLRTEEDPEQADGLRVGSRQVRTQAGWGHEHKQPCAPCSGMGSVLVCAHQGGGRCSPGSVAPG